MSDSYRGLPPDFDWVLFIQHLLGLCPEDRRDQVAGWAHQSSVVRAVQAALWVRVSPEAEESTARIIAGVDSKIAHASSGRTVRLGTSPVKSWNSWVSGAGVLAAVCLLVLLGTKYLSNRHIPSVPVKSYTTNAGQRATINLGDGTKVILNVASKLEVPEGFGKTHRTLELKGEAQFTVTHSKELPFIVKANGTTVRDLATVFIIRAYEGSPQTMVAVRDGKVSVQSPALTQARAVTLAANEAATISADGIPILNQINSNDRIFAWTSGQLVLRQAPLGEALSELSRWYGLEFRANDQMLLKDSVSIKLPAEFSEQRIRDLADILGATATRTNEVITFNPRHR